MKTTIGKKFYKSKVALCCALFFGANTSLEAAEVNGVITDSSERIKLEGALVEIKSLNVKAITQRDGTFELRNLPAGKYTLDVQYLGQISKQIEVTVSEGAPAKVQLALSSDQNMEEVIVRGLRSSQLDALNRQKNSSNLKSIVSADSIGQFPDQNAAEALQRLPGMFIQRDQGEGRFVGIRGIDPNLNNVTINGANIPAPEAGVRSVAMDVIPSELIQGLEVSKTVTPDMDADAIGGSIEVKSLSAFDRNGRSFTVTAQASYNDLQEEASPKLSGSFTDIIDLDGGQQLGVATAISWFERKFGSDNIETDGGWMDYELEDASDNDVEFFGAEEIEQRDYEITRERLGVALNLDFIASATSQYYLRTLYSEFSDDEYRQRNEYAFEQGQYVTATANSLAVTDARMDRDTKDRYEEQTILSTVLGGENRMDKWLFEYSLAYSLSKEEEPDRLDITFREKGLDLQYLSSGQLPQLVADFDVNDFEMDEIETNDNKTEDEEVSFKIDISRDVEFAGATGVVKFGGKYRDREKTNEVDVVIYDGGFDDVTAGMFSQDVDWVLGDFGSGISRSQVRDFYRNATALELNQNESDVASKGESYVSDETIAALYAMADLSWDKWQVIAGLRYESTEFSTKGNIVRLDVNEDTETETLSVEDLALDKDYSHLLPSVNVKYDYNDKLVMRFAYTQTISRPNFGDSAAFQLIEVETEDGESEVNAEVGNPALDPYEATNLDFSVEYYPGDLGVISAGVFYKDIENFIQSEQEVQDNGQWDGFNEVKQAVNGDSADITGFELAYSKGFDNGFIIAANATLTDASEQLPSQSDTIGNLTLGYENDAFSVRLTSTYKSEAFLFEDSDRRVYESEHQQLDLNVKYYVNENSFVYFNGINLGDEEYYLYHGTEAYNYQYESYGSTYEIGFTYNSF